MSANHVYIKGKRQYQLTSKSQRWFTKHKNSIENLEIVRPKQVCLPEITYVGTRSNPMWSRMPILLEDYES